jgi:hypothetical protein
LALVPSTFIQIELSSVTKYIPFALISSEVSTVNIQSLASEFIFPFLTKSINLFPHYNLISPLLLSNSGEEEEPAS